MIGTALNTAACLMLSVDPGEQGPCSSVITCEGSLPADDKYRSTKQLLAPPLRPCTKPTPAVGYFNHRIFNLVGQLTRQLSSFH